MNTALIEVTLALFWLVYLGLHLWLMRADPVEDIPMMHEVKG